MLTVLYLDGILDWLSDKARMFYNGARSAYQKLAPMIEIVAPAVASAIPLLNPAAKMALSAKNIADRLFASHEKM